MKRFCLFLFRHPRAIVICTSMEAQQVYPISRGTRTAGRDCSVNSSESVTRTERLLQYILLIINHLDKESKNLSRLLLLSLSLSDENYILISRKLLYQRFEKNVNEGERRFFFSLQNLHILQEEFQKKKRWYLFRDLINTAA